MIWPVRLSRELDELSREVPEDWLESATAYRRELDRNASVLGRVLLCRLLEHDGLNPTGYKWQITEHKRPYLLDSNRGIIHFSISHSGDWVACAYAMRIPVGIDLEKCVPRPPQIFEKIFAADELEFVRKSRDPTRTISEVWTRKEAVAKASGKGMYLPFRSFSTMGDSVEVEGATYRIMALNGPEGYALHASVKSPDPVPAQYLDATVLLGK